MHAMTVDVAVSGGQEQNSTTSNTIAGLAAQMLSGEERDDLLEARHPCAACRNGGCMLPPNQSRH